MAPTSITLDAADKSASDLIDAKLAKLNDWRGATLARLRGLIRRADLRIAEEIK